MKKRYVVIDEVRDDSVEWEILAEDALEAKSEMKRLQYTNENGYYLYLRVSGQGESEE